MTIYTLLCWRVFFWYYLALRDAIPVFQGYLQFRRTYSFPSSTTLKMDAACSSVSQVSPFQTTWCHNPPQDHNMYISKICIHGCKCTCEKTPKIHFIYLGNKEVYCIFKTCCIMCVLVSTKCHLFHTFTFFCSNWFFINHALKFKYSPLWNKV